MDPQATLEKWATAPTYAERDDARCDYNLWRRQGGFAAQLPGGDRVLSLDTLAALVRSDTEVGSATFAMFRADVCVAMGWAL